MTTLKDAIRSAIEEAGFKFGRVVAATGGNATTAVSSTLARGEPSSNYVNKFVTRRDATAAADHSRPISNFAGASGTITHLGTAGGGLDYSDTTVNGEVIEITVVPPELLEQAAQVTLGENRRKHLDIIPANGQASYPLDQYSWIQKRGDIMAVYHNATRDLARNSTFDGWNVVSSAGALEPDNWTKTGAGSTWTRSTTNPAIGPYALSVTRSGTDVTVEQYLGGGGALRSLLGDGVNDMATETRTVTLLLIASGTTASSLKGFINDGITTTQTAFHTAGGLEVITVSKTIAATATQLSYGFTLAADGTLVVSRCGIFLGEVTDADKQRKARPQSDHAWGFDDRPPTLWPGYALSRGATYQIETLRPYPSLDATRLRAGTADADESDIPEQLWTWGILANTLREMGTDWADMASKYRYEYDRLRTAYMSDTRPPKYAPRARGTQPRRA